MSLAYRNGKRHYVITKPRYAPRIPRERLIAELASRGIELITPERGPEQMRSLLTGEQVGVAFDLTTLETKNYSSLLIAIERFCSREEAEAFHV